MGVAPPAPLSSLPCAAPLVLSAWPLSAPAPLAPAFAAAAAAFDSPSAGVAALPSPAAAPSPSLGGIAGLPSQYTSFISGSTFATFFSAHSTRTVMCGTCTAGSGSPEMPVAPDPAPARCGLPAADVEPGATARCGVPAPAAALAAAAPGATLAAAGLAFTGSVFCLGNMTVALARTAVFTIFSRYLDRALAGRVDASMVARGKGAASLPMYSCWCSTHTGHTNRLAVCCLSPWCRRLNMQHTWCSQPLHRSHSTHPSVGTCSFHFFRLAFA